VQQGSSAFSGRLGPVAGLRKILLACLVMVSFSGCIGDTPEVQSSIIDTLVGEDEPADPGPAEVAEPSPEEETPVLPEAVVTAEEPAEAVPEYVPRAPRTSFHLAEQESARTARSNVPTLEAMAAFQGSRGGQAQGPQPLRTPFTFPTADVEAEAPPVVAAPTGYFAMSKTWAMSAGGAEYASGCLEDGVDCAYIDIPTSSAGQEFTLRFQALVPPAFYFADLYMGGTYWGTVGDPTGAFALTGYSTDPIPGTPGATFTGTLPAGVTQVRPYATGGADFVAQFETGENPCKLDSFAIGSPTADFFITPFDSLDAPGSLWVYPGDTFGQAVNPVASATIGQNGGSNGEPGLQRNDSTYGTTCTTGDVWAY
jgi:hypothetical protein